MDYKGFIENRLRIIDKELNEVPFVLNPIQNKFIELMSGRDIILKARQQGFSSLILAMFAVDFLTMPNSNSVVVADKSENAISLLTRVKYFLQSYLDYQNEKNKTNWKLKEILDYNSKYQMTNKHNNATYTIGTAQEQNFGRSKTITNLHLSEAAFYPDLPNMLAGAAQAVTPKGKLIIETTANGFNSFKTLWEDSVLKQTAYQPLFFRAEDFYDKEYLQQKRMELGERLFDQEYPSTPEVSFITSGDTYFNQEAMIAYLEEVKGIKPMKEIVETV